MIETTGSLVQRQGYHGTGLNQIIEESGAPKGSMYFHFPGGKEALVCEAVRHCGERSVEAIEELLAGCDHPGKAVGSVVDWFAQDLEDSDFERGCPVAIVVLRDSTAAC